MKCEEDQNYKIWLDMQFGLGNLKKLDGIGEHDD